MKIDPKSARPSTAAMLTPAASCRLLRTRKLMIGSSIVSSRQISSTNDTNDVIAKSRHEPRVEPVVALTLLEHELQRADARRQQQEPEHVDLVGALLVHRSSARR